MILYTDEEDLRDMLGPLRLEEKLVVLCPLNDAQSSSGGGSHWAMLIVARETLKSPLAAFLLDSGSGSPMTGVANEAFSRLCTLMNDTKTNSTALKTVTSFPKQDNMSDCGIFALCGAEAFLEMARVSDGLAGGV